MGGGNTDVEDRTMPYADQVRALFPTLELEVADLFALKAHQIAEFPTRAGSTSRVRVTARGRALSPGLRS
jgi:hypothetical protein